MDNIDVAGTELTQSWPVYKLVNLNTKKIVRRAGLRYADVDASKMIQHIKNHPDTPYEIVVTRKYRNIINNKEQ